MDNRIREIHIANRRLDPVEAEVCVSVYPEHAASGVQVRGQLTGPRCPYSSTVEVAYPLREWSRENERHGVPRKDLRGIIPEPCLWDPATPFLYEGPVELWEDAQCCDQVHITHGLRRFNLGPHGLRWNGRLLTLRGAVRSSFQDDEALQFHRAGGNLLLAPVPGGRTALWEKADRQGFLVLGRIADLEGLVEARHLARHVCCLGWILAYQLWHADLATDVLPGDLASSGHPVGIELTHEPRQPLPGWVQFLVCSDDLLSAVVDIQLPKILLTRAQSPQSLKDNSGTTQILGWICG